MLWEAHVLHVFPKDVICDSIKSFGVLDKAEEQLFALFTVLFNDHF